MTPALPTLRFGALLNTASGSCDAEAEKALQESLAAAGIRPVRIWCGTGPHVPEALEEAMSGILDVLIVVAGDGTIRAAAEQCGAEGPILMPLPGGTMNMLPKTLYGELSWREALKASLASPQVQWVHGGLVAGHRFFVAGIFGEPTRFAKAREAVRQGDLSGALEKGVSALTQALSEELRFEFGSKRGKAETILALCPVASAQLDNDAPLLEAAAIDFDGPLDAFRLAFHAIVSDWRNDPKVETARLSAFEIEADVPVRALLDGESFKLGTSARVEFVPRAFRALRPA